MITVSKIFVFSDSIGTYTSFYTVEWLLGTDIDTIITTDEVVFEDLKKIFKYKVECYSSIEACVSNCDIIVVYSGKSLPKHVINKIKSISIIQNKRYIEIDRCKSIEPRDTINYDFINGNKLDTPAVVIFSLGLATIPMKVEFDISRIFGGAGVAINHFLSLDAAEIIRQFGDAGIDIDKIDLFNRYQYANCSVYFLDLDNSIHNIYKYYNQIIAIKPDYVIVLTDYDLSDYDELSMYIKCFCMRSPDVIVKSRWFSIGNNMFCHSDRFDILQQNKKQFVLDFEDQDFLEKIKFDMFSKITLAEGIKRIP